MLMAAYVMYGFDSAQNFPRRPGTPARPRPRPS
jgi:hypothetical protein